MRRIAIFLVLLLLILTFNAYACLLPLQPESMDCSSATEQPVRQTSTQKGMAYAYHFIDEPCRSCPRLDPTVREREFRYNV